jgi:hypothetical protein
MKHELVQAHVPYRQVFMKAPPKRRLWSNWFVEKMHLAIEIVDPAEAPVAYEVCFGPDGLPRQFGYPIRSYLNDLWWPVGGDYNYILHSETFATMLQDGHPETLVLLDPSFQSSIKSRPLSPFPEEWRRVEHDYNNLENQRAAAQRGASTVIFCNDGTFVRGGEPVYYAVPEGREDDKSLSLGVGISDLRREADGTSRSVPGPTRSERISSARRGFAFGIGEIDDAVRSLRASGYAVDRNNYGIEVLTECHRAETAPLVCARELARHLFVGSDEDESFATRLLQQVPIVGYVAREHTDEDLSVEALRHLCASDSWFPEEEVRAARSILERVRTVPLSPEDDAWLSALAS